MTSEQIVDWAAARSEKWRRQLTGLEAMLAPIDEPLIEALALDAPARIADVGCGSGSTTVNVSRRAPAGSAVHGFDLSPALIEVARRRDGAHDSPVAFEVADVGTTAPPEQPYDRLISRLGVMFFNDPPAAFANLRRWLVPGGRFAFAVWGPLEDNTWMTATRAAVAEAIDLAPLVPSAPGPFRYGEVTPLLSLLTRAGFANVTATDWRHAIPIGNGLAGPDAAHFALASFSSFAELLSKAGGDAHARARAALTARFIPYQQDGIVLMPARVHIVTGQAIEP
jgi:SAM-dependent methyltransferase